MEDLSIFCHIFMALPGVKLQTIVDGVHTPNLLTNRLDWNQICWQMGLSLSFVGNTVLSSTNDMQQMCKQAKYRGCHPLRLPMAMPLDILLWKSRILFLIQWRMFKPPEALHNHTLSKLCYLIQNSSSQIICHYKNLSNMEHIALSYHPRILLFLFHLRPFPGIYFVKT